MKPALLILLLLFCILPTGCSAKQRDTSKLPRIIGHGYHQGDPFTRAKPTSSTPHSIEKAPTSTP